MVRAATSAHLTWLTTLLLLCVPSPEWAKINFLNLSQHSAKALLDIYMRSSDILT